MPQRRKQNRIMVEGDDVSSLPYEDVSEQLNEQPSEDHRRNRNRHSAKQAYSSGRRKHHRSASSSSPSDMHERTRRYLYSAISATFFFVLFRELGWIDQMQTRLNDQQELLRQSRTMQKGDGGGALSHGASSLAAAAANMAATSMSLSQRAANNINSIGGGSSGGSTMTRGEMMDHVLQVDNSITPGSRPIMYTFFEWIPPRSRGTSMSDGADKALITEWKAAWKAAGWHPMVLTLEDAKKHPQYNDYAPKLNKIPMLGVDGLGGTVIYNQLCFLRWLAVAAAGGGYLCDYDVFPVSSAPPQLAPPHNGNFTVYCRIKDSKRAGIPCFMSGAKDEWTRMAYALLANGEKNAGTETMWSDMLALIDMRNDNAYATYDAVLEGQDVLLKRGWVEKDCNLTAHKEAIHFSHEALKLGYLPPGESAEDRPEIIRRFLAQWLQVCGNSRGSTTQSVLTDGGGGASDNKV